MSTEWIFTLSLNRQITPDEADRIDTTDDFPMFVDGSATYTTGGSGSSELYCDVEAETLLEAVAMVSQQVRQIRGLRAVRLQHEEIVTLEIAAQRTGGRRSRQSLVQLSKGQRGPGGFPQPEERVGGTTFYSWPKVAAYLRDLGDDIDEAPRDQIIADLALRLADEVEVAGYAMREPVLRSLGLFSI